MVLAFVESRVQNATCIPDSFSLRGTKSVIAFDADDLALMGGLLDLE